MASNQLLTIGDVWQPNQGNELINVLNMKQHFEDARVRNRLNFMALDQAERDNRIKQALINSYPGGEKGYIEASVAQQQAAALKETTAEQMKVVEPIVKSLIESGDSEGLKKMMSVWETHPILGPVAKQLKTLDFNVVGKGEVEVQLDLNDKTRNDMLLRTQDPLVAQAISDMPPGKVKVKSKGGRITEITPARPVSTETEANYRIGLEKQMRIDHGPGTADPWPEEKVQFEAAKQVRQENEKAARERVLFGIQERGKETDRQREARRREGFGAFTEEEKQVLYETQMRTGQLPKFAFGDQFSYTSYQQGYTQYLLGKGFKPEEITAKVARMQSDFKAQQSSLTKQRNIYDIMNGFVINLNSQIDSIDKDYKALPRTNMKLFNMPIVQLRNYVTGSGEEASVKAKLLEISNEVAKLSTNSQASIRELSTEAQERWEKIHSEKLPFNEIVKVLRTSKQLANFRLQSNQKAMEETQRAIEMESVSPRTQFPDTPGGTNYAPFDIKLSPDDAKTIDSILKKRGVK